MIEFCRTRAPIPTVVFFFFNDTATTEIYTLSLHDALPICAAEKGPGRAAAAAHGAGARLPGAAAQRADRARKRSPARALDRKSTRLNSSHGYISYAVFCLKKKNTFTLNRATDTADAGHIRI